MTLFEAGSTVTNASLYDVLTLGMNVAQTCFLAWLAARYSRH